MSQALHLIYKKSSMVPMWCVQNSFFFSFLFCFCFLNEALVSIPYSSVSRHISNDCCN